MLDVGKKCCGCGACAAVCPVKAIQCVEEERGTVYYKITGECIKCGRCESICPIDKDMAYQEQDSFLKAIVKEQHILIKSSSGGIAYVLSYKIIQNGGVVYGAAWVPKKQSVQHIRVDSFENLHRLQGSKYVQSMLYRDTYQYIKDDLKRRIVLFIGTPCQVAAIRNYTQDNSNLICIDLICHGVPSAKLLNDQLKSLSTLPIEEISFRNGLDFSLDLKTANEHFLIDGLDNPYFSLFLQFASLRESCYSCKYACSERVGDITLGDFVENNEGYSCIVTSTPRGKALLESVKNVINFKQMDLKSLYSNHAFNRPTIKHHKTDKFTYLYQKYGLINAYNMCFMDLILKRKAKKLVGEKWYTAIKNLIKRKN